MQHSGCIFNMEYTRHLVAGYLLGFILYSFGNAKLRYAS